jgi:hypothetical protein
VPLFFCISARSSPARISARRRTKSMEYVVDARRTRISGVKKGARGCSCVRA